MYVQPSIDHATAAAGAAPITKVGRAGDSLPSASASEAGQVPYADMMTRFLGDAVMAAFRDDDVTEIYINPQDGRVRYDTRRQGRVDSGHHLETSRVEMFLNTVAASLNATLGATAARIEAELPQRYFRGSRLQGFVPPATAAPACVIRKPPTIVYTLDDYVTAGVLTSVQRAALAGAVTAHDNVLIAGGTNSGKTTLANALLREITEQYPDERIVVLEDTVELQCMARDHLALRTGPGITLAELVRSALRTSPNRIVVGEVRGSEALDLLDAWATGHPGGCGTCHATSAEGALLRLDRLAQRNNVPPQTALIAEAVDLVAVVEGGNRGRRLADLARVAGLDATGRIVLHHLTSKGNWQ
jgi:type IV secretion system protein VirB11